MHRCVVKYKPPLQGNLEGSFLPRTEQEMIKLGGVLEQEEQEAVANIDKLKEKHEA